MAKVTIGQLSTGTTLSTTDYLEAEISGVSKKITIQTLLNYMTPLGAIVETAYEKTISESFPAIPLRVDSVVSKTNYPLIVPELRAAAVEVILTAGTSVTSINVNATAGSILSSVDSAFTIILNGILEEFAIQGSYSIPVTIGGTDYTITSASASSSFTISGTIATGATTMTVYPHRIVGSTTTAKVYKDTGRATLAMDGNRSLMGFRRRDRMQGHWHVANGSIMVGHQTSSNLNTGIAAGPSYTKVGILSDSSPQTPNNSINAPITDGTNGTPRTGLVTEPNSSTVFRYIWAQVYNP